MAKKVDYTKPSTKLHPPPKHIPIPKQFVSQEQQQEKKR
jgi:hypothetical protein